MANSIIYYYITFFIIGAGMDGFRLAFSNLILIIAPEDKNEDFSGEVKIRLAS